MPLDAAAILSHRFDPIEQGYSGREAILYALGVGLGSDPLDESDLDYLLEDRAKVLPTFAATLASPGMWIRDRAFGVDFAKLVHAEQAMTFESPLPPAARVVATPRVTGLFDRGQGRGAVLVVERDIADATSGALFARVTQTLLLRGDGGFGGDPPPRSSDAAPGDPPDSEQTLRVSPRAALIYRLSGDLNPLHGDPAFAARAGFQRPILHGLATYGMAARALERQSGGELASLSCRFAGVVYPGDEIRLKTWRATDREVRFAASVGDRPVLDRGVARLK
jgi:acyl dehydratase